MEMPRPPAERTPFGERLYTARKYAKLSQGELAARVGLSQSALAESEKIGQGSTKTLQIAAVTGVDANWLATGLGHMVTRVEQELSPYFVNRPAAAPIPLVTPPTAHTLINQLGELLDRHDQLTRLSIAPLLQRLAEHPQERGAIADHVSRMLGSQGNTPAPGSSSSQGGAPLQSTVNTVFQKGG